MILHHADIASRRDDALLQLAALKDGQAEIARQIEIYEHFLRTLDELVAFEAIEGELQQTRAERFKHLIEIPSAAVSLSSSEDEDEADDDDEVDLGKKKFISRRWYEFVNEALIKETPMTVEQLLAAAPSDLRDDFLKTKSKFPTEYRARRLLRRNPEFLVDRASGSVSLAAQTAAPTSPKPPPMPAVPTDPVIITEWYFDDKGLQFAWNRRGTDKSGTTGFNGMVEWVTTKSGQLWVANASGDLDAIATYEEAVNHKPVFRSYNTTGWTVSLNAAKRPVASTT